MMIAMQYTRYELEKNDPGIRFSDPENRDKILKSVHEKYDEILSEWHEIGIEYEHAAPAQTNSDPGNAYINGIIDDLCWSSGIEPDDRPLMIPGQEKLFMDLGIEIPEQDQPEEKRKVSPDLSR